MESTDPYKLPLRPFAFERVLKDLTRPFRTMEEIVAEHALTWFNSVKVIELPPGTPAEGEITLTDADKFIFDRMVKTPLPDLSDEPNQ